MRLLFMFMTAVMLVGGGAGGAYFYFQHSAQASVGPVDESQKAANAKRAAENERKKNHEFVELDPLILPIIDEHGVNQIVSFVVMIEVENAEAAKEVEAMTPRLKDAYIQDMYGILNKQAALRGGVVQVGIIKDRLNKITQRVVGEGLVEEVLLQVVQQRPI
jgi:flagellar FliL protein